MFSLVNKHEEFFDFLVTNAEYFHKGTVMAKRFFRILPSWNVIPKK